MTQLVAVKVDHQFPQAGVGGCEVDLDFGVLPRFNCTSKSKEGKYLHIIIATGTVALSHYPPSINV